MSELFAWWRRWQERRAKKRRETEALIRIVAALKEQDKVFAELRMLDIAWKKHLQALTRHEREEARGDG